LADAQESGPLPLVSALLKPGTHPQGSSYVFLTERYVFKVKKPVDFGFLNYSTLGKCRYFRHREVGLNSLLYEHT
jgi:aminoglycoside phosphotransferase family enzyme